MNSYGMAMPCQGWISTFVYISLIPNCNGVKGVFKNCSNVFKFEYRSMFSYYINKVFNTGMDNIQFAL